MERLIWELMQVSIQREMESIAFDKRNALDLGIPEEEIDKFITDTAREQFDRYKDMPKEKIDELLYKKTIMSAFENSSLDKALAMLQEGDED